MPEPKYTPEVQATFCRELANGVPVWVAASRAGLADRTVRLWRQKGRAGEEPYATFAAAVKRAQADAVAKFAGVIETAAVDTWQAAAWWLERRHPGDWGSSRRELADLKRQYLDLLDRVLNGGAGGPPATGPANGPRRRPRRG